MLVITTDSSLARALHKRMAERNPRYAARVEVRAGQEKAIAKLRFDDNCRKGGFIYACLVEAFLG